MSLKRASIFILFAFFGCQEISAAKILGIFMGLGQNHYVLGKSFMMNLVEANHDCILISRYGDQKNNIMRYREIIVRDDENSDSLFEATQEVNHNPICAMQRIYENSKRIIPKVFEDNQVKMLLNETFDLVIIEEVFVDALKVLAWHFKANLIIFHPRRADFWVNSYMGNPSLPSYISEYPSSFGVDMNFLERLQNVALYIYVSFFKEFVNLKQHNEIKNRYFNNSPDLADIIYNTSLAFLNSDVSIHQSVPKLQNMIDIGGFHITPPRILPGEVQQFLYNSTNGVIYIDLKFLTSSFLPEETRNWMIKVFSEFKYDFLWIWDEDHISNQPSNLMLRDSVNQAAVLANPKTKLFIHLGDTTDIIEGVYYGVPQILIPVSDDQLYDSAQGRYYEYARTLPFSTMKEEDLRLALQDLLNNSSYSQESKKKSKVIREKLISPKKKAVFWVNNVLETDGAAYVRSTSLDYSWYQLFGLDILGVFIGIILIVFFLLKTLVRKLCSICCISSKKRSKTKSYNSLCSIAE